MRVKESKASHPICPCRKGRAMDKYGPLNTDSLSRKSSSRREKNGVDEENVVRRKSLTPRSIWDARIDGSMVSCRFEMKFVVNKIAY